MSDGETMGDILDEDDLDIGMGDSGSEGSETLEEPGENTDVQESTGDIMDLLKSKSPNKPLEEYKDSPLDVDGEESTWRMLRGAEGLFGELTYALLDIGIGFYQKIGELGEGSETDNQWTEPGGAP